MSMMLLTQVQHCPRGIEVFACSRGMMCSQFAEYGMQAETLLTSMWVHA